MRTVGLRATLVVVMLTGLATWTRADHDSSAGRKADSHSSKVASTWFEALYDVVKAEGTPPPQASRIYGITAVAFYESVVEGTKRHRSLVGQLNGLTGVPRPLPNRPYDWPTVANEAIADTVRGIFPALSPASLAAIDDLEESLAPRHVPRKVRERSIAHGEAVAEAILAWSAGDGFSTNNNCPYDPAPVPWEPTPPLFAPNPLQPCWG